MNSTILAIDLGKFNSVLCWFDPGARAERFRTAPTTPDDLRREVQTVPVPPRAVRQWKSLIGLRKRLVAERVRGQNRIRGLLVSQGLPAPTGTRAWTAAGLAGIGQLARPLADCGPDDLWRGEL